ncbi:MAG: aldo/keto reductase [Gemmatimonadota bacterium]
MEYRRLGKSGLQVSEVSFGGHQKGGYHGDFAAGLAQRAAVIHRALELGITYFDNTEEHEAESLSQVFRELGGRPAHATVAAMYPSWKLHRAEYPGVAADMKRRVATEIDKHLVDFDPIDVFNLCGNGLPYSRERTLGGLEALEEARHQGKVRHFGFSTHTMDYALAMIENHPEFCLIMFPYNVVLPRIAEILFPVAARCDVAVVGMKAMGARGLLNLGIDAAGYGPGVTVARTALRWVLQSPQVACSIPAMNNLEEVEENATASGAPLTADEERLVEDLRRAFDEKVRTDPAWYYHRDWTRRLYGEA